MLQRMERREILGKRGQETMQDMRLEGGDLVTLKRGVHRTELTDVEIMMGEKEGIRWLREVINRRRDSSVEEA